jgi:hypothetical protein
LRLFYSSAAQFAAVKKSPKDRKPWSGRWALPSHLFFALQFGASVRNHGFSVVPVRESRGMDSPSGRINYFPRDCAVSAESMT